MNRSDETASLLKAIPGGYALLEWFDGTPEFGDGEVVGLVLDRDGKSRLSIKMGYRARIAVIHFELSALIDISLRGFSHQNVIGGLRLQRADDRVIEPWERGVGVEPGGLEIELEPCFGAYGRIRANITSITLDQTAATIG